ncbi:MAG: 3-deoxy-8-phosphooctulonate synthase [Caulobacterales bacterium 32-67-6]|nr:MAG: 3-deoxy-8-phosphooctulonate synthase [Caulobacterales bacterium 32-67-6]
MAALELTRWNMPIGAGHPLVVIAGLNVLEDLDLARAAARHLQGVCTELGLPYVFKASFDTANRDLHEIDQAEPVAAVADLVQIPAFLCRQTDLVVATARATKAAGGLLHVKKGQFLAPWDSRNILDKIKEAVEVDMTILCERGVSFGYNNLVVDMLGIAEMQALGAPVTIDATHAVQLPGANPKSNGASTGGRREGVPIIAKAAVAAGADGVFLEFHHDPDRALCDGPSCLPLTQAMPLLRTLKALRDAVQA